VHVVVARPGTWREHEADAGGGVLDLDALVVWCESVAQASGSTRACRHL
jgi:hypothetical protein